MSVTKRAFTVNSFSAAAQFAINLASVVALSRLLTPAEIGTYSVALASIALIATFREFGVGLYLIKKQDLSDDFIRAAIGVLCAMSSALALIQYGAAAPIARFYAQPALELVIKTLCLNYSLIPISIIVNGLLRRNLRFATSVKVAIVGALATTVSGIGMVYAGYGVLGLAIASVIGNCVLSIVYLAVCPAGTPWRPGLRHWREVAAFGATLTYSNLMLQLGRSAPDLIIGRVLGMTPVALLSRANGLRMLVVNYLLRIVQNTFVPIFAAELRNGEDITERFFRRNLIVTLLYTCAYASLIPLSGPLMMLFFGEQWLPAVPIAQVLCAVAVLNTPLLLILAVINAKGEVGLVAKMETQIVVARTFAAFCGCWFGLIYVAYMFILSACIYGYWMSAGAQLTLGISGTTICIRAWKPFVIGVLSALAAALVVPLMPDYSTSESSAAICVATAGSASAIVLLVGIFVSKNPLATLLVDGLKHLRVR